MEAKARHDTSQYGLPAERERLDGALAIVSGRSCGIAHREGGKIIAEEAFPCQTELPGRDPFSLNDDCIATVVGLLCGVEHANGIERTA